MNNKQNGHIISHTHWDREWRVPEWNARWRLGVMMDRLLEKLKDNPDFIFLFDGQVVSIEDYLELYPARRDEIVEYIKQGRLNIGPWYNLPDLYPVSGETLIRNLLIGRERAQRLGGCLDIAYTTFGWGQTAQFPQIFDGFGIKRIVCAKNVSKQRAPNSEFYWQSPDGTKVFTTRLGVEKRANFYFFTLMPVLYGCDYKDFETRLHWGKDGWFWHSADSNTESELSLIPVESFHDEVLDKALDETWDTCRDTLAPENLFMGNGCDSTAPNDVVDKIIEIANASDDRRNLFYSSLERYFDAIEKEIESKGIELKTVYGELRDGPVHSLSANALATRMPLKSLNRAAQNSLVRYGEPLAALAYLRGIDYPQSFIDKGWCFLLLAHSHDALNGVTLEKTACDTQNKFEQVCEIGQVVNDMSAVELLKQVDMSSCADDDIMLAVFNPSPSPKRHVAHAVIDVPQEINCRYLTATDTDGSSLAVQPVDHVSRQLPVCVQNSRALPFYADRHTMYIDTGTIPPLGYKIIKLSPGEQYSRETKFWLPSYEFGSQVCGVNRMANEYLEVSINNDGTFNVCDKITGELFENLGSFEDGGDAGDYWQRLVPSHDRVYSSLGKEANIYLAIDGSLVTSYVCETIMKIPASVIKESQFKSCRSNEMTEMKLKTTLTLKAGSRYLEVDVEVDNNARDHRLRMCMPTFVDTDTSDAQGHFNVDSRTIGRDYVNGKRDGGMSTLPMQNFVDLAGGETFICCA